MRLCDRQLRTARTTWRTARRKALADEAAALEADETGRREMLHVAALMESLRAPGDIHEIRMPRGHGHEQQGRRFGVVVQADEFLPRSVVLTHSADLTQRRAPRLAYDVL